MGNVQNDQTQIDPKKLFVGGLPWKLRGQNLKEIFAEYGEVLFARVVLDKETRKSKGYGFVEFASEESAKKAKEELDGSEIDGRPIKVDFAQQNNRFEKKTRDEE